MKSQKINQYLRIIRTGFLKNHTHFILNHIYLNGGVTLYEMRNTTKISHQTITAIISQLMDLGIVKIVGKSEIKDRHYSKFCVVTDVMEIEENAIDRENDRVKYWIKNGLDYDLPVALKNELNRFKDNLGNNRNQLDLF